MITNFSYCMGCKIIFNKEYTRAFCKICISRYKIKFINDNKKIKDENQILHTKENKKKLMLDLLSRKSFNNINIEEIKIKFESDSEKKLLN